MIRKMECDLSVRSAPKPERKAVNPDAASKHEQNEQVFRLLNKNKQTGTKTSKHEQNELIMIMIMIYYHYLTIMII